MEITDSQKTKLSNFLYESLKDKTSIDNLKLALVNSKQFEFASEIRSIEKELFPITKEAIEAEQKAQEIEILFNLLGIKTDYKTAWLMFSAIELYLDKKGKTDLKDAADLKAKANEYFI